MKSKLVEDYIAGFEPEIQKRLQLMRETILSVAPDAEECISYKMPAYKLNGILVYFAGYKNHIGFYALPTGHAKFINDLVNYKTGKGSVQFPNSSDLPIDLIKKMVEFRVEENLSKIK
jgi:uncharacterized protein YdhG (YjbR/CyaY superfamily)